MKQLADRQLQVLRLLAVGHTHKSAARELGLSHETVRSHCIVMRARLGAKTSEHAVAIGARMGLLDGVEL